MAKKKDDAPPRPVPPGVPPDGPVAAADDALAPPEFGTARPAGDGALPRVIDPLDRATPGTRRFKVRCNNYSPRKTRYVLAAAGDADGARACYLAAEGLDREIARLKKVAGAKAAEVEEPDLVVTELPD